MKKAVLSFVFILFFFGSAYAEFPAVEVYEKTAKNVVLIIAKSEGTGSMIGAGSVISKSGIISTNAHVVIDKATSKPYSIIRVYLKPDKVTGKFTKDLVHRHVAKVTAYDIDLDLAILQVEDVLPGTGIIELADPEEIRVGEEAVAIGHPEQGGLWTLTYGRISGGIEDQNSVKGKNVFQTDASVNRGNSGGPLLDKRGYMIGINSNMARLGEGDIPITGVNFAVKSSVLKKWLEGNGVMIAYGTSELYTAPPLERAEPSVEKVEPAVKKAEPPIEKQEVKAKEEGKQIRQTEVENKGKTVNDLQAEKTKIQKEKEPKEDTKDGSEDKMQETKTGERYQPHRNSYDYNALLKAVEEELEDMMEEMRRSIRR